MTQWIRELADDPGNLGHWAAKLLQTELPATAREEIKTGELNAWWPWAFDAPTQPELPASYLDECRRLRSALLLRQPAPQVVLLTAAESGAGVTTLARNLAPVSAALASKSCLLVQTRDALSEGPGLTDVLAGDARWEAAVRRAVNAPSLCWIDAGGSAVPLADLLAGPEWSWVCAQARLSFDFILIDGVALNEDAAAAALVHAADAVVLVARPGWTTHPGLVAAQRLIPAEKMAGIVLNG